MDGDLFFGKLSVGKDQKKKKGPTDAKTQLKMLEAKKEKLEKLKDEDKSKADQAKEKEEWNKVIALATGEKPRDDVGTGSRSRGSTKSSDLAEAGESPGMIAESCATGSGPSVSCMRFSWGMTSL